MTISWKECVKAAIQEWEQVRYELSHIARSDLTTFTGRQLREANDVAEKALVAMHLYQRLLCRAAGIPWKLPERSEGQFGLSPELEDLVAKVLEDLPPIDSDDAMTGAQVKELESILLGEPLPKGTTSVQEAEAQWLRFLSIEELNHQ